MIRAFIFELDGTLGQTEKLKALSYAVAGQRLLEPSQPVQRAVEAYREIVETHHIMERLVETVRRRVKEHNCTVHGAEK